jgi:hypothetical protein
MGPGERVEVLAALPRPPMQKDDWGHPVTGRPTHAVEQTSAVEGDLVRSRTKRGGQRVIRDDPTTGVDARRQGCRDENQ